MAGEEPAAEPVDEVAGPTHTITLPSRPTPPEPLSGESEPAAEDVSDEPEPVVDAEPVLEDEPVLEAEPVVEDEPAEEAESFEVEPYEVESFHVEPIDVESMVPVESTVEVEEPAVEVEEPAVEVEEPEAADTLPSAMSPSLEGLAADVAAAQEAPQEEPAVDDEPVNVKSVETVSAMDLIMGAAEEDPAKSDEDDTPASA